MDIPFKTPAAALAALLLAASGYSSAVMASDTAAAAQPGQVHAPGDVQTAQNGPRGDRSPGQGDDQTRKKNAPATPAAKPNGGRGQDRVRQDRREAPKAAPRRTRPEARGQQPSRQRDAVRDRRRDDRPVVRTVDRPRREPVTRNREQVRRETVIQERRARFKTYHRNYDAPRRFRVDQYRWDRGHSYRRYGYGQMLPSYYYGRSFWISSFLLYGLFAPPSGLIWVRYGPDALLIDEETGEIVQVRYNMFYS